MTITVDPWSPLASLDEAPLCLSHYYPAPGGLYLGPLVCIYDAGHPISGGPLSRHCGGSSQLTHHWSDAEAALSLVEFGPSARTTGPLCVDCEIRPQSAGGRCQVCAAAELAADHIETESEAA